MMLPCKEQVLAVRSVDVSGVSKVFHIPLMLAFKVSSTCLSKACRLTEVFGTTSRGHIPDTLTRVKKSSSLVEWTFTSRWRISHGGILLRTSQLCGLCYFVLTSQWYFPEGKSSTRQSWVELVCEIVARYGFVGGLVTKGMPMSRMTRKLKTYVVKCSKLLDINSDSE